MIIGRRIVTPEMIDQNTKRRIFFSLMIMSMSIGTDISPTKGQPSNTDIAVKNIASLYFWWYQADIADIEKYIENELGSSAVEEMNIPALKIWNTSHDRPMWTPNSRQMPLKYLKWARYSKKSVFHLTCRNNSQPKHIQDRAATGQSRRSSLGSYRVVAL